MLQYSKNRSVSKKDLKIFLFQGEDGLPGPYGSPGLDGLPVRCDLYSNDTSEVEQIQKKCSTFFPIKKKNMFKRVQHIESHSHT